MSKADKRSVWHSPGSVHSKASSHIVLTGSEQPSNQAEKKRSQSGFKSFSSGGLVWLANGCTYAQFVKWNRLDVVSSCSGSELLLVTGSVSHTEPQTLKTENLPTDEDACETDPHFVFPHCFKFVFPPPAFLFLFFYILNLPDWPPPFGSNQRQYIYSYIFIHIDKSYVKTLCKAV